MGSYRLTWKPFGGGRLALGHRPGKRLRKQLEDGGCTLVVSLLSRDESTATENDRRVRLPLAGAHPPGKDRDPEVLALFARIREELAAEGSVFVHCSAGLHRTGMIAYAFFRWSGLAPADAVEQIRDLRSLTADELTAARQVWGERFALPATQDGER